MARQRDARTLGIVGVFVVLTTTVALTGLDSVPILSAGTIYRAEFGEAAGLASANEVRIAGVKVGKVSAVELDGDHVAVTFKVTDAWIGDKTTASIQIKTVLGQKYLALDPRGERQLKGDEVIPRDRTMSPYDVMDAFSAVSDTVSPIDSSQLAQSFTVLSEAFSDTPADAKVALEGVGRLSETITQRDRELTRLFESTRTTSQILANRNLEFNRLIQDAGHLIGELNYRHQAIDQLLSAVQRVSEQLTGFARENEATLRPALTQLNAVITILRSENENIGRTLELYDPFVRMFTNVVGNGRWFDAAFTNLTPPGLPGVPGYRPPVRDYYPN
ncbi:MCE family protein [Rhodococcus qingshengii]|uniref:MCE family protein n=1 Tax=Rhodococcus qingshengii TaxID=334542 RepID=UPI00237CDEF1|nr:MCE family protein [Rhodococcus qingshengii]WCT05767.1 MCE family protein [Rhodococcus qingshengii]